MPPNGRRWVGRSHRERTATLGPALLVAAAVALLPGPRLLAAHPSPAPSERRAAPESPEALPSPGGRLERTLAGGEAHVYSVELAAGEFLRAVVDQRGVDLLVRLDGPDGDRLFEGDSPNGTDGPEPLSFVADTGGVYRIEVASLDPGAPTGSYELAVEALRPARPADRLLVAAERLETAAAVDTWVTATAESRRRAAREYAEAVALWERLGERRRLMEALNALAVVHSLLGEPAAAADSYRRALGLARGLGDGGKEAFYLLSLAAQYDALGRGHDAEELYRSSLALADQLDLPAVAAGAANGLCALLRRRGELDEALALGRRSVELRRTLGLDRDLGRSLNNLALVFRALGRADAADELFREALPVTRRTGDVETEAAVLHNLGRAAMAEGRLHEALDHYRRVREINRRRGDRRGEMFALGAIAGLLNRLGRPAEARPEFLRTLELSRQIGDRASEGHALANLGWTLGRLGEPRQAELNLESALDIAEEVGDRQLEMAALRDLVKVRRAAGNLASAERAAETLLRVAREVGSPVGEAAARQERGETLAAAGEHEAALRDLTAAVETLSRHERPMQESSALLALARTERALDRLDAARGRLEQAIELLEGVRSGVVVPDFRDSLFASRRELHDEHVDLLMELDHRRPGEGWAELALSASERARARGLLDLLAESEVDLRQGVAPELVAREKALQQTLDALERRRLELSAAAESADRGEGAGAELPTEQVEAELRRVRDEHRWVEAEIRTASPRYASLAATDPLSASEIRELLDGTTVLLSYHLGPARSFLWALTRDELASYTLPPSRELEALARDFHLLAARAPGGDGDDELRAPAERLGETLLAPAVRLLAGRRLAVLPDGALHYLPYAALDDPTVEPGGPPRPIVAGHEVVYLPSASTLAALRTDRRQGPEASHTLALIADPVFQPDDPRLGPDHATRSAGRTEGFRRLRFSRLEAEKVAAFVPPEERLEAYDFEASRETVTGERLADYRLVHFATHGVLHAEMPELSGLVLSLVGPDGERRDGYLRLHEIYDLRLAADLVTLSACRTALGEEVRGEGLVGLARGFMYAGASRVVASLWDVEDRATAELMAHFYRGMLEEGLPPAAALRLAQVSMWEEERWRHPYYWAAFVLVGPWD